MSDINSSRNSEDQLITDRIITVGQAIEAITADRELTERLARVGYAAAQLAEGRRLQQAAQTAFDTWQAAARTTHRQPQAFDTAARATYQSRQMGFPAGAGLVTVNHPASTDAASANLEAARADRDEAVQRFEAWWKALMQAAQSVLRDRPDLVKKLQS